MSHRSLALAFLGLPAVMPGACTPDIQLDAGHTLKYACFIRVDQHNIRQPELLFELADGRAPWTAMKIRFDMGGFCWDGTRLWSDVVNVGPEKKIYKHTVESLSKGHFLQGCESELIRARILRGDDDDTRPGLTAEEVDSHRDQRAAEAEERQKMIAEQRAQAAEEKSRAETARRQRAAAEEKKRAAAEKKRVAEAREKVVDAAIEQHRKLEASCSAIYRSTADKKLRDLTVKEEQQVRACQQIDMYPPR